MSNTFTRMDLSEFDGREYQPLRIDERDADEFWFGDGYLSVRPDTDRPSYEEPNIPFAHDLADLAKLFVAAPNFLAALRAAYAEIDRLRANALEWVTVTEDDRTLPEQDSERDVLVDAVRWDDGEPSEMRTYYVLHLESDSIENLSPGDRWAYIPEAQA